jgi:hypothetical protein
MRLLGSILSTNPFFRKKSLSRDVNAGNIMFYKLDLSEVITNRLPYFKETLKCLLSNKF